jgi:hypothetical protein
MGVEITGEVSICHWYVALASLSRDRLAKNGSTGETPSEFVMLTSPSHASVTLLKLDNKKDLALVCINDDVKARPRETDKIIKTWMEERFGTPAQWERDLERDATRTYTGRRSGDDGYAELV